MNLPVVAIPRWVKPSHQVFHNTGRIYPEDVFSLIMKNASFDSVRFEDKIREMNSPLLIFS
jgi:hypothetical protein